MAGKFHFAIPGDIETRTGGTIYDKRVMAELRLSGWTVDHLAWPASFPFPSKADEDAVVASLATCPDGALVMIDGLAFGVLPELAAREADRLRLVALVHHPLALESGLDFETAQNLARSERRALAYARAAIVTSDMTAATLARDYGVPARRITVAKPGVDRPELDGLRNAIPHLLTVGTVTPRKGHDVLIDALAAIVDLDWRCRIAGSLDRAPETAAALRTRIALSGLGDRATLMGEVADPAPFYRTSDLFVLPSRYEGYGMAIAEALAHGLPVIATRVGAIPEIVPPDAGILVPVDDPVALAAALRRVLEDAAYRERLTLGARRAAAGFAEWPRTAARIASALDRIQ